MKKAMLGAVCLVLVVSCIGCNTIKGLGEDVATVGGWMVTGADNVEKGGTN